MFLEKKPKGNFKQNLIELSQIKLRDRKSALLFIAKLIESVFLIVSFLFFMVILGGFDRALIDLNEIIAIGLYSTLYSLFKYFFESAFMMEILIGTIFIPGAFFIIILMN